MHWWCDALLRGYGFCPAPCRFVPVEGTNTKQCGWALQRFRSHGYGRPRRGRENRFYASAHGKTRTPDWISCGMWPAVDRAGHLSRSACCQTFTGISAFDRRRKDSRCVDPATRGLCRRQSGHGDRIRVDAERLPAVTRRACAGNASRRPDDEGSCSVRPSLLSEPRSAVWRVQ